MFTRMWTECETNITAENNCINFLKLSPAFAKTFQSVYSTGKLCCSVARLGDSEYY